MIKLKDIFESNGGIVAPDGTIQGAPTPKQVKKMKKFLDKQDNEREKPIKEEWLDPDFEKERSKIDKIASLFGTSTDYLYGIISSNGSLTRLNDQIWSVLQNTDSWQTLGVEDITNKLAGMNRDQQEAIINKVIKPIENNEPITAPIIAYFSQDDQYYLVSGEIKLMVAKAIGVRPEVWLVKVGKIDPDQDNDYTGNIYRQLGKT